MMRVALALVLASLLFTVGVQAADRDGSAGSFSLRPVPETVWSQSAASAEPFFAHAGQQDGLESRGAPSKGRAVLYSLLLPGLGDFYAGQKDRARYFFITEAAIWVSFAVFRVQGFQDEEAYQNFALQFAGVKRTDHSDDFYAELRDWDSSEEYEAVIKADGRFDLFPDIGSDALDVYFTETRMSDFEPWEWESLERRLQFAQLRSSSKRAYRRATYSVAAAGVNRVVSALFAYHAAKMAEGSRAIGPDQSRGRYHLDFSPPQRHAVEYDAAVSIVRTF